LDPGQQEPSLFLAERYLPGGSRELAYADMLEARRASSELEAEGTHVRCVSSTVVPEDETCFALFEAGSAGEVEALIKRARLTYQHVVEAVQIGGDDESAA
jgi:hypothetical protein